MSKNFLSGIKKLQENVSSIPKSEEVNLAELMNEEFIKKCSEFKSLQELIDESPFNTETKEDFLAIPDKDWDVYINETTNYESWLEMQKSAALERAKAAMLKGLK